MNQPNTDDHKDNPEDNGGNPNQQNLIHNVNATPKDQSTPTPEAAADNQQGPSAWSKILESTLDWLRHYWGKPREKSKRTDIATVVLTVVIAAAALYSAWVFEGQLVEMRSANKVAKQSSDDQANVIKDQFRLDERPIVWLASPTAADPVTISFQLVQATPTSPKQIAISVHYANFGKSPAVKLIGRQQIALGPDAQDRFKPETLASQAGYLLPPGKVDFFTVTSGALKDEEVVQQAGTTAIPPLLRDFCVAFRARFQYFDSLGFKYQTDMCMARLQSGAFAWCRSGNTIKDCSKEPCD